MIWIELTAFIYLLIYLPHGQPTDASLTISNISLCLDVVLTQSSIATPRFGGNATSVSGSGNEAGNSKLISFYDPRNDS